MLSQVVRDRHRAPPCNTDPLPLHSVAWPVGGLRHKGTQKDRLPGTQQRAGFRDVRRLIVLLGHAEPSVWAGGVRDAAGFYTQS